MHSKRYSNKKNINTCSFNLFVSAHFNFFRTFHWVHNLKMSKPKCKTTNKSKHIVVASEKHSCICVEKFQHFTKSKVSNIRQSSKTVENQNWKKKKNKEKNSKNVCISIYLIWLPKKVQCPEKLTQKMVWKDVGLHDTLGNKLLLLFFFFFRKSKHTNVYM